ncbi:CTP--phosphocholine cytidylyltransferase [Bacteroides fluxus]|uniref:LicC protein n=1 Tax=Bacteroides fluxus YIT 12057 TaxID=763034 RepID=F3PXT3_9BACE|nr:CTP--phosphocholine cytidylyltransferase [Bacteroides fluxus]EGF51665.1 LicC protein [Bacteroides fluxus YIT 12057]
MNAIILAAGLGTRLRPLTNERPKCMVEVCGIPMVERQILFLHEVGITDITLVSGYKAESLDYLKAKYAVDIVPNPKYDTVNNIYSMYVVKERFGDSYVLEGDVYMQKNCLRKEVGSSTYFSVWKKEYKREWGLVTDENGVLDHVHIGDGQGYIMSGISYWTKSNAAKIVNRIDRLIENESYKDLFWDNAVIDSIPVLDSIKVDGVDGIYEIDTVEELRELEGELY